MTSSLQPDVRSDPDSVPFWQACQRRELLGQRCGACGVWRWPPRAHCPRCHAAAPVWERLAGTGEVVGHVVVRRAMDPAFADRTPLAIVHVRLDGTDGEMVLTSNLLPGQWPQAAVGLPVAVRFVLARSGLVLPHFTIDYPRLASAHEALDAPRAVDRPAPTPAPAQASHRRKKLKARSALAVDAADDRRSS